MKTEELKKYLLNIDSKFQRNIIIESLSTQISTNKELLNSIQNILEECKTFDGLKQNNPLCSYCIHILIQSQRPEGMFLLIQYIKSLDDFMPLTFVEFLGRLLPFFGKIIIGPAKELCQYPLNTPQHAIGIQTLCNLFLDGLLGQENYLYLIELIKDFESDSYFTKNLIEMVKSTSEFRTLINKIYKDTKENDDTIDLSSITDEEIIIDDSFLVEKNKNN